MILLKSLGSQLHCLSDYPSPSQVLQTSHSEDPLRCEHCCDDFLAQEVVGAGSEDGAEILQGEVALLIKLGSNLSELLDAILREVEGKYVFLVDISSAAPEVDEPHNTIESLFALCK